jgi:hypothetical protein
MAMLSFTQAQEPTPTLSQDPLTGEQLAVYRTFLRFYANGRNKTLQVADVTERLDSSEVKQDSDCAESFGRVEFESPKQNNPTVHTLAPSLAVAGRIALVDSVKQAETVKLNDPSQTIREGKPVDRAVSDAFASGFLTLSEIAFDRDHRKAVMSYRFVCGRLCGNGAVVMLRRVGRKWKVTKPTCGESIS